MKDKDNDGSLRRHLLELLKGGSAHIGFDEAIAGIPAGLRGRKPAGLPHSPWMLLEHLRIAQWDILEFSRNRKYVSPDWPKDYWPGSEAPPRLAAWDASIKKFRQDLKTMQALVASPKTDLYARSPWGDGPTILREALLLADHNAYHLAQLVDVRRLLGVWPRK
ncbi:MAG: DinB family protein [Terriglobales bacterium]